MRSFVNSISKHKHVVHATITKEGVPAVQLKKIPMYRLIRICQNMGLTLTSVDDRRHHHLYVRDKQGLLVATIVNNDLILMPKDLKEKETAFELVNTLANYREGKKTR